MSTTIRLEEIKVESNNEGFKIGKGDYPVANVVTLQDGLYPKILPSVPTLEVIDPVGNQQGSYPTETVLISTSVEKSPNADGSILTSPKLSPAVVGKGFIEMWRNNWQEFITILPGLAIIFGSSHHTAWAINEWLGFNYGMPQYVFYGTLIWFVGAVLGSVLGASLVSITKKRCLYFIGTLLLGIAGFLHLYDPSTYLCIDRLLCGASFGIANLTVIIHASDITSKDMRDFALKCIAFTMALSLIVFGPLEHESSSKFVGQVLVYLSELAFGLIFLASESIPFLIVRGESAKAMQRLTEYNCESIPSDKTKYAYDELKSVIDEEKLKSKNVFSADNLRPLVIVGAARLLNLLSSSILILVMILSYEHLIRGQFQARLKFVQLYFFFCISRLVLGSVGQCLSRFTNRYHFYYGITTLSGIILFITSLIPRFFWVFLFLNLLAAVGLDAMKNVQVAELFPMNKRAWSIVVGDVLEHSIHVLLLVLYRYDCIPVVLILTGHGLVAAIIVLHKLMDKNRKN